MTPRRPLLAATLAMGLLAGCSRNAPPPSSQPSESGGTPAQTDKPANETPTPPADTPSAGSNAAETAATQQSATYYVRDSGIRCIAPPCPAFIATRVDKPDEDGLQITDLDLNALGLSQEKRDSLMEATHTAPGIKVEAILGIGASAGPAGPAKILRISRVLESK
ncbi:lipoprotein [Cystobacter fuscus]|uniref:Lipoprotein n=1 Tax=Cystobacter fuscus TaxID=43 RepID=A0A250IYR2_9BACT|nr:DUF6748 domain-containing protein [Cystobacter fuscus]ATB36388.1 lipoprotein [Cystobacter fuscus]